MSKNNCETSYLQDLCQLLHDLGVPLLGPVHPRLVHLADHNDHLLDLGLGDARDVSVHLVKANNIRHKEKHKLNTIFKSQNKSLLEPVVQL